MSNTLPKSLRRSVFATLAAAEWFALGLQFYLTLKMRPASLAGVVSATMLFTSFFTIFASTLVAIVATGLALRPDGWLSRRSTLPAAVAVYITIVAVFWMTLLRGTYALSGLWLVADGLMHVVIPPLYVVAWLFLVPKGRCRFRDAATWLILPLAYAAWMLGRAAVDGWYPYSFLNAAKLGYATVTLVILVMCGAFWITGLMFIGVDRFLGRRQRSTQGGGGTSDSITRESDAGDESR